MDKNLELELEHKELIAEEQISIKDLPKELRNRINGINLLAGRYNKNPNFTDKERIEKKSLELADEIQDFIEEEYPEKDDDDSDDGDGNSDEKSKDNESHDENAKKVEKTTEQAEKEILSIIEKDGKIYSHDLMKIIGASSIDEIPDKFKIGNTTLEYDFRYYYKSE